MTAKPTATVLRANEGDAFWSFGDLVTFKVGPEQSNGTFALAELAVQPGGGPPPHLHEREDETFVVVEGELLFTFENKQYIGKPGDAFFLPRGRVHTFHNASQHRAKALVMALPCGFEKFMSRFGLPAAQHPTPPPVTPQDVERLLAVAPEYGISMKFDHKPTGAPVAAPRPHKSVCVMGNRIDIALTSRDTNDCFTYVTISSDPGCGVPEHAHREQDELFYVREGTWEFTLDGRRVTAEPGATIFLPKRTMHALKNVGRSRGVLADFHWPGGFEEFFLEAGEPVGATEQPPAPRPMDPAMAKALFNRHGMEVPA